MAVFAKAPIPGRVKTRLTPVLRAEEAADLQRALLLDTVEVAEAARAETVVAFTPMDARRLFERLLGARRRSIPQGPGELGQRLLYAFERLCEGRRPVLAVGTDCPGLSPERIREAADALARAEVVVGPALDGGYYLIGMTRPRAELFRDIPWSTGEVVSATRRRIAETGARARFLPSERDIDTPRDLFEWYAEAQAARVRETYPRTWSVVHAALPPRRFAELESALRPERGEGR